MRHISTLEANLQHRLAMRNHNLEEKATAQSQRLRQQLEESGQHYRATIQRKAENFPNNLQQELQFRSLGTTPISGNRSRSEKDILGALGEFRGILGATLRIQKKTILGMRNPSVGMALDLSNAKTVMVT